MKVSLHVDEGGSGDGLFTDDDTATGSEAVVNSTDGVVGALDFNKEDRLLQPGGGGEHGSVEHTSGGGDDLTTTSVDSISMEGNILDVHSASSHVLLSHDTLFGGPLEGSLDGILDFVKVLDGLGDINDHVGPVVSGPKHQILSASLGSHSNSSLRMILRALGSCLAETLSSSMAWARSSPRGAALQKILLCLLGDLERQVWVEMSVTHSL